MKKASYKKVEMGYWDFADALMKWGKGEGILMDIMAMSPKLYKDDAFVSVVALMKSALDFLGDDFDWYGDNHTWLERRAVNEYKMCSRLIYMLVFDVKASIDYYKAKTEEKAES